jgi:uroporphyrin-3 C-methyltransferase
VDPPVLPDAAPVEAPAVAPPAAAAGTPMRWVAAGAVLLACLSSAAVVYAWNTQQRLKSLEGELVRRQQDSGAQATEARTLARNAELAAREAAAKVALLDARVAETALQRSQFEDLVQSLARSRDENVLADIDAAIRVALQQNAITGSAEPLLLVLKQSEERLARYNQPRLERVRRAVAQDLERTRAAGVADLGVLTIRIDEVVRSIDELPLLAQVERRGPPASSASASAPAATTTASAASAPAPRTLGWAASFGERGQALLGSFWQEVKSLVRVTRIDAPEAMLLAPDQAYFLRENLKLRLLNARLALLSRQFDTAQLDLREARTALDRYFDRNQRRVQQASEMLSQVASQARAVTVPRPDATLAAIATATAGR